ncbi:septum site-determining protein Ssd [Nocardioides limicola]|uniref:septum site-determining protein Ssd n=1 Tax=Nocardioides limicola TaxID=2803368 RepID=UPI00193C638C|nr:septum site-determining protein Ssd [Nocardioides sp. DJM-14]
MTDDVLIATRDPALADEVVRLAAAAGAEAIVVEETLAARQLWPSARSVLVARDLVTELAAAGPDRRPGVLVVTDRAVTDSEYRAALAVGAEQVIELSTSSHLVVEALTDAGDQAVPATTIAVIGGSGGAGASTFAAALAQTAARQLPTLLVDADPLGAGADRVLGLEEEPGVRWDDLARSVGRLSGRSLREAVPRRADLGVLTYPAGTVTPLEPGTVRRVLSAARRGHRAVIVDLPRTFTGGAEEVLAATDRVVVITVATVAGVAATVRLVARLGSGRTGIVVRGAGVDGATIGALTGLPVMAEMRDQRGLAEAVDLGAGPAHARRSVLARTAVEVLRDCGVAA